MCTGVQLARLLGVVIFVMAMYAIPSPALAHEGRGAAEFSAASTAAESTIASSSFYFSSSPAVGLASLEADPHASCVGGCSDDAFCCALIIPYVSPLIGLTLSAPDFGRVLSDVPVGVVPDVDRRPPRTFT